MRAAALETAGQAQDAGQGAQPLDPLLYHQLRKIGVNINQIAHVCNATGRVPPRELVLALNELRGLMASMSGRGK